LQARIANRFHRARQNMRAQELGRRRLHGADEPEAPERPAVQSYPATLLLCKVGREQVARDIPSIKLLAQARPELAVDGHVAAGPETLHEGADSRPEVEGIIIGVIPRNRFPLLRSARLLQSQAPFSRG